MIEGEEKRNVEPGRPESSRDRLPSLEEEFGREGSVIAVVVDLTRMAGYVPLDAILGTLNSDDWKREEGKKLINILSKAGFRRVSLDRVGFSDKEEPVGDEEGNYWMRPAGQEEANAWDFVGDDGVAKTVDVARIHEIVDEHVLDNGTVDFGLGGESPDVHIPLDDLRFKDYAVAAPKDNRKVLEIDDPHEVPPPIRQFH